MGERKQSFFRVLLAQIVGSLAGGRWLYLRSPRTVALYALAGHEAIERSLQVLPRSFAERGLSRVTFRVPVGAQSPPLGGAMFDLILGMSALISRFCGAAMCGGLAPCLWAAAALAVAGRPRDRHGHRCPQETTKRFYRCTGTLCQRKPAARPLPNTGSAPPTQAAGTGCVLVFADHPDRGGRSGIMRPWIAAFFVAARVLLYLALTMWPLTRYT